MVLKIRDKSRVLLYLGPGKVSSYSHKNFRDLGHRRLPQHIYEFPILLLGCSENYSHLES